MDQSKINEWKGNLGSLISAISIYHGDFEGAYPKHLADLAPKYIPAIPADPYTGSNKEVFVYDETGGWVYDPETGEVNPNFQSEISPPAAPSIDLFQMTYLSKNGRWVTDKKKAETLKTQSLAVDSKGNLYYPMDDVIHKLTPEGVDSAFAGSVSAGYLDGKGKAARFNIENGGIAVDASDNVYVVDDKNFVIRKITPDSVVSTFAGSAGVSGVSDGPANKASFFNPMYIAASPTGTLYISDSFCMIRQITPDGAVKTVLGAGSPVTGANAYNQCNLRGVAADGTGNAYVTDHNAVIKIGPDGAESTFVGDQMAEDHNDGIGTGALFKAPVGLTSDSSGNLYVGDYGNNRIRRISSDGTVMTLAGDDSFTWMGNPPEKSVAFIANPAAIAIDPSGNLYALETTEGYPVGMIVQFKRQ